MSWRRGIGFVIGVTAIVLTTVAIVAPTQILASLPPGAERTLTRQPVQPAIAGLLAVYATWMVFSRGWLSLVREESGGADGAELTSAGDRIDAGESDEDTRLESTDHAGDASESISVLGRDVLTFSSQTDIQPTADEKASVSIGNSEPDTDSLEEAEPPAGPKAISISPDEFDALRSTAPEHPQEGAESVVGSEFESTVAEARRSYGNRDDLFSVFDVDQDLVDESAFSRSPRAVRRRLIATADALEESRSASGGPAADSSEWTTDAAVRSFLDPDHPDSLSLLDRLRVWLIPEAMFERVVERSTKVLADADDGGDDR